MLNSFTGRRKALESKQAGIPNKKWVVYTDQSNIPKSTSLIQHPNDQSNHSIFHHSIENTQATKNQNFCDLNPAQREAFYKMMRAQVAHMINNPTLTPNISFSTPQLNVITAMCTNATLMGLTIDLLNDDLASQFNLVGPSSLHLPPSLWPSKSQRKIIHHPWIDLIPMLSMRESLLSRMDTVDEDELCGDLYGAPQSDETGLRVWGEAWDPLAYEVSEALVKKWSWMIEECPDIIESTNYWRRRRGQKALALKQS
jgi:hypothetical protein